MAQNPVLQPQKLAGRSTGAQDQLRRREEENEREREGATEYQHPTKEGETWHKKQNLKQLQITKKEWKGRVVQPSAVTRQYCVPDQVLINSKVKNFMAWVKEPTGVQIAQLEAEIGGVIIEQVETFAGRVR